MFYFKNKILYFFQLLVISLNYIFNKNFNEKELLNNNLRKNAVVFDVGSNLGSYIKFVDKTCNKSTISFHSFEPNKKIIQFQKQIRLKGKSNLFLNNKVVLDKHGDFINFYERSISSHSSVIPLPKMSAISEPIDQYKVETVRLDSYCVENDIDYIDILKIDAEGVDFQVLLSCENLLKNNKINLIKIEVWAEDLKTYQIFQYLNNFNFQLVGMTNQSYLNNTLKFFDAYFLKIK